MSIMYMILPLSLVMALVAVVAFRWATKKGQFDDLDTPAWRVVLDDESGRAPPAPPPPGAP
jgi:cbb3-type cytochrome oxidase maturation protein